MTPQQPQQSTALPPIQQQSQLPGDVQSAQSDSGDQSYNNYCEKFVEQAVYGKAGMFPTAADAINSYSQQGQAFAGTQGIQPGDMVYFAPDKSNRFEGHAGIYSGNGSFVSATDNGVEEYSLKDWEKQTGQQLVGYVPPPQQSSQKSQ